MKIHSGLNYQNKNMKVHCEPRMLLKLYCQNKVNATETYELFVLNISHIKCVIGVFWTHACDVCHLTHT